MDEKDRNLKDEFGDLTLVTARAEYIKGGKIRCLGMFSDGVERVCRTATSRRYGVVVLHAAVSNMGGHGITKYISCHNDHNGVGLSRWRPSSDTIISVVEIVYPDAPAQLPLF